MTYSIHTLVNPTAPHSEEEEVVPRMGWARFTQEFGLIVAGACLVLCFLSLISYNVQDPSWSSSGVDGQVRNWIGKLGAWIADIAYFLLGFSAWWCLAAGARAWLVALAQWLRGEALPPAYGGSITRSRAGFWLGMAILLSASCSMEWLRLYKLDASLPGQSGGALGYAVGKLSLQWLGFTGSALASLVLGVVGVALVFRFSWGRLAESIGAWIDARIASRQEKLEIQQDYELGQRALRERDHPMPVEPTLQAMDLGDANLNGPSLATAFKEALPAVPAAATHPPVLIEPTAQPVAQSERVQKERQKPLFKELPDSKLPQVDLLDHLTVRQEGVALETLEMTSRMIEKRLKDFGVEVRVLAAAPGVHRW